MTAGTRILFASADDAADPGAWSGTPHHMHRALAATGAEVVLASPLSERFGPALRLGQGLWNGVGVSRYARDREPLIVRGYAEQVRAAVRRTSPHLIVAPSSLPVALLDTDVPVVFWTDATFAGMADYYPSFTGLAPRYRRLGNEMEAAALSRATLAVYSSEWAAETAEREYGVASDRLAVIPFGANLADPGPVPRAARPDGPCRLLLVGKDWYRKGADLAVATVVELRSRGVDASLDVIGCGPPRGELLPRGVTIHPSADKAAPDGSRLIARLYRQASFFILPSRADCTPIVLAEAAAYGLPVVACATGGMTSMVRDGRSGHLVRHDGFASAAAGAIERTWRGGGYAAMGGQARQFYEERVNWDTAVRSLVQAVDERLSRS